MEHSDYFDYLKERGCLGLIYRRYYLYPRICRRLKGKVLDVGCGLGDMLAYRPNTIGVDINPFTIEWCRGKGYEAYTMKNSSLPFSEAEFDGVVLDNVLEHIIEPMALLKEINRILVENGHLLIGVPGRKGYASDPDHKTFYDQERLVAEVEKYGFKLSEIFYAPIRSKWLDRNMRQYCLYGVFRT
ncbi:MAG: class I SAM-dependent methyltransferase [Gammaproteobacteria bacterium]|nr:class I SAM-dependent methyltransferase [Gammaproteobacteria bacterium]